MTTRAEAAEAELAEARAERNEIAGRLSALLDHLTGGLMSKTNYPVPVMVQAIEAEFEKYAESEVREWKRHADGWEEAWRQENAERKAIETRLAEARAQVERVRALAENGPYVYYTIGEDPGYAAAIPVVVLAAALGPADTANERGEV